MPRIWRKPRQEAGQGTEPPKCNPSTTATEGAQSHATKRREAVQASPEKPYGAARSGAQMQAIHGPGIYTARSTHKRHAEPRRNSCYPYTIHARNAAYGRAGSPQRASHRRCKSAGEGKHTAATAPAQRPGRKSGRFSVFFSVISGGFFRFCSALRMNFIVESR